MSHTQHPGRALPREGRLSSVQDLAKLTGERPLGPALLPAEFI